MNTQGHTRDAGALAAPLCLAADQARHARPSWLTVTHCSSSVSRANTSSCARMGWPTPAWRRRSCAMARRRARVSVIAVRVRWGTATRTTLAPATLSHGSCVYLCIYKSHRAPGPRTRKEDLEKTARGLKGGDTGARSSVGRRSAICPASESRYVQKDASGRDSPVAVARGSPFATPRQVAGGNGGTRGRRQRGRRADRGRRGPAVRRGRCETCRVQEG